MTEKLFSSFFPKSPNFLLRYPVFIFSSVLFGFGLFELYLGQQETANLVFQLVLIFGGIPLAYGTIKELLKKNYGADIIAVLAIITSLLLKEYLAGAIIIIMLSGGRALEDFALQSASDALKKLAEAAPSIAHLVKGKEISDIKVESVRVADTLLVKPGELIPVDAVIIKGETSINESALTGEPVPTHKTYNSAVLSGSVNLDNPIQIRAIRKASESKYEQIVKLVRDAQATKAPLHRLADRYGAIFTPVTLFVAAATYIFTQDSINVLAVLVVATPCPLILATPIAIMGGINRSAKKGIIVRNGGAIERVGQAEAVVFDKTGTLTFGLPKIVEIKQFDMTSTKEILRYAGSVERLSAHILAKSTVNIAHEQSIDLVFPENFKETFGKGVAGEVDGKQIAVGSQGFIKDHGGEIFPELEGFKKEQNELGRIVSFVAIDKKVNSALVFGDEIRPDIKKTISELRNLGIKQIAMLTGDSKKVADQVAAQTGIDLVKAQTLPDEKVEFINKLKETYSHVVMVGDGFNDAPALVSATVGIALGASGSSISSESADIVLVENNIEKVNQVIGIGRKVLSIARGGILFGMGASFVAMLFAAFGFISPVKGAILQEAIDIVVILNALRASR